MTIIEQIFRRIDQARAKQKAQSYPPYKSMVIALARGEEIDVDDLDALMEENGKSRTELERDVEKMQRRIEQRAKFERKEQIEKSITEQEATLLAAQKEFEAAQRKYNAISGPLLASLNSLQAQQTEVSRAAIELTSSCDDPEIQQAEKELAEQRAELGKRARFLEYQLDSGFLPWLPKAAPYSHAGSPFCFYWRASCLSR